MLKEKDANANSRKKREEFDLRNHDHAEDLELRILYPFNVPIAFEPETLVGLLTLTAHIMEHAISKNILAQIGISLAVVVISALVYFSYAYGPAITKAVSPSTARGILRAITFILHCIGVQIAWNGLSALLAQIVRP